MALDSSEDIFNGKGLSLADIVVEGKLGGRRAVHQYLRVRSSQAKRILASTDADPELLDRARTLDLAFTQADAFLRKVPTIG